MAYLRNIVHLPFYLQNAGLRKVTVAQQLAANRNRTKSSAWYEIDNSDRKLSTIDQDLGSHRGGVKGKTSRTRKTSLSRRNSGQSISSVSSKFNNYGGNQNPADLTKVSFYDFKYF